MRKLVVIFFLVLILVTGCWGNDETGNMLTPGESSTVDKTNQGLEVDMKNDLIRILDIKHEDITGYWNFDENDGETITDLSDNGNDVTSPGRATGLSNRGGALSLKNNERLDIREQADIFGYEEFTINFFLYLDKLTPNQFTIISKDYGGAPSFRLIVEGMPSFVINTNETGWYSENSLNKFGENINFAAMVGSWKMLTITYDGKNLAMYCNGELSQQYSLKGTMINSISAPLTIGSNANGISGFDGRMDELLVLKKSVKAENVKEMYNQYLTKFEYTPYNADENTGSRTVEGEDITELYENFKEPVAAYRMGQYLMGLHINPSNLKNMGIGTAVLGLGTNNYLNNEDEWRKLKRDVEACLNAGLGVWLFDEDFFPSGGAGGNTISESTEQHEVRGLQAVSKPVKAGEKATIALPGSGEKFITAIAIQQ